MKFELLCNSVRGASHIHKDIPCEDYGMKKDCGDIKIFVTSDGHGDPNCLRSQLGSKFICEVAVSNLEKFASAILEEKKESELFDPVKREKRVRHLVTCIMSEWLKKVNNNFESDPPTEEDFSKAATYADDFKKGIRIERAYGATLIAGVCTEKFMLLLQQGDGRCVLFNSDGSVCQPVPWDERCVGNMTTSLCDPDAIESFRYCVVDLEENPVLACFAGSDGVEDSFPTSMERTHAYYRELLGYACENGIPALEDYMSEELSRLSVSGSQDDVTVTGIADLERIEDFLEQFSVENEYVDLVDRDAAVEMQIRSIEEGGKYGYLQKKYLDASSKFEELDKKYKSLATECDNLRLQIELQENPDAIEQEISLMLSNEANNSEENDENAKNSEKGLLSTLVSFVKEKFMWSGEYLTAEKQRYEFKSQEKERAEGEWQKAKEAKDKAEAEFVPYNDRYEDLKRQKKELENKISEFEQQRKIY